MKVTATDPTLNGNAGSQLMALADGLMDRAATLAAQSDQLIAALDDVARRLVESGGAVASSPSIPTPIKLLQRNGQPDRNGSQKPAISDGARLLITQMAVAGSSHDEIAARLTGAFGEKNADEILELLGL